MWGSEVAILTLPATGVKGDAEEDEGTPALKVAYRVQEQEAGASFEGKKEDSGGCCSAGGEGGHGAHEHEAVLPPSEALEMTLPLEEWHAVRVVGAAGQSST